MLLQYFTYFPSLFFVVALLLFFIVVLRTHELPSRTLRWGLFVSVALLLSRGIVYSVLQYRFWQKALPYLLPPYQPTYFLKYASFRFFSSFFLSCVIALLLLFVFWALQRYSRGKWLDTNERLLVFFGALSAGWPGAVLYAIGVFVLPLIVTPWLAGAVHDRRIRLAPFIIISAFLAMGLTPLILPHAPWLEVLVCKTCL
ncbi:MAG: hypothetical protein Q7S16_01020 [bacterium]|nr:hypothetical protein [bacterium]